MGVLYHMSEVDILSHEKVNQISLLIYFGNSKHDLYMRYIDINRNPTSYRCQITYQTPNLSRAPDSLVLVDRLVSPTMSPSPTPFLRPL